MKILFVLPLPPPVHGSSVVGQFIKDSNLINRSFDTKFINLNTSKSIHEIGKNPLIKINRYLKILYKLILNLICFKPEIVYLSINAKGIGFYKDFLVVFLIKLFGRKLVLHYHNKGVKESQRNMINNILYKYLFKNTKVILLSRLLYNDIENYVEKKNVFYCANGIPITNLSIHRFKELEDSYVTKILFLSNLIKSKGICVLINALKILQLKEMKFHCSIVGGEGDISPEELNNMISDLDLNDQVTYLGKKYNNEKYEMFLNSDIFVLPTFYHNECFPLVILEAMQFGLATISTNEGAIPEIIDDGKTGFLIEKQNSEALAKKISWFLKNPNKLKEMGENARIKFLNNYSIDIFEKQLTTILNGFENE